LLIAVLDCGLEIRKTSTALFSDSERSENVDISDRSEELKKQLDKLVGTTTLKKRREYSDKSKRFSAIETGLQSRKARLGPHGKCRNNKPMWRFQRRLRDDVDFSLPGAAEMPI
jgi:hypothetical protein